MGRPPSEGAAPPLGSPLRDILVHRSSGTAGSTGQPLGALRLLATNFLVVLSRAWRAPICRASSRSLARWRRILRRWVSVRRFGFVPMASRNCVHGFWAGRAEFRSGRVAAKAEAGQMTADRRRWGGLEPVVFFLRSLERVGWVE